MHLGAGSVTHSRFHRWDYTARPVSAQGPGRGVQRIAQWLIWPHLMIDFPREPMGGNGAACAFRPLARPHPISLSSRTQ